MNTQTKMKATIFLLILLQVFGHVNGQEYLKAFNQFNEKYNYDWYGIETKDATGKVKQRFLDYCKANDLLREERMAFTRHPNYGHIENSVKIVDLNGDGYDDFIYAGPTMGEKEIVKFLLSTGDKKFVESFVIYQGVVLVEWDDQRRISKILTHDWGCCAEIIHTNNVFSVSYNSQNKPTFTKTYQSIETTLITRPLTYFEDPIDFISTEDDSELRFAPIKDDSTYYSSSFNSRRKGNVISFLRKGTAGKLYGSATDDAGMVWYYVEIADPSNLNQCIIDLSVFKFPTYVVGWISSNQVFLL